MNEEELKYPIGKFNIPVSYTEKEINGWINELKLFPVILSNAVSCLSYLQLDTPYRIGGWSIRQVVHHLADGQMNGLFRLKWALTENEPVIKGYEQADWATLPDYSLPVQSSLNIVEGAHLHLASIFEALSEQEMERIFIHPASGEKIPVKRLLPLYVWHARHHLEHIKGAVIRLCSSGGLIANQLAR